jgi:hypothetical protein
MNIKAALFTKNKLSTVALTLLCAAGALQAGDEKKAPQAPGNQANAESLYVSIGGIRMMFTPLPSGEMLVLSSGGCGNCDACRARRPNSGDTHDVAIWLANLSLGGSASSQASNSSPQAPQATAPSNHNAQRSGNRNRSRSPEGSSEKRFKRDREGK